MQEYLEKLRDESIYIKLEATTKIAGAIDVENLIKVLTSINQSYKSFLEIELNNNSSVKSSSPKGIKEVKHFIKENELLIVDLNYASFGAAISPNTTTTSHYSNITNSLKLKKQAFEDYKNDVFYGDFRSREHVDYISNKYTEKQRTEIFKPLIVNLFQNSALKVYYGKDKNHLNLISKNSITKEVIDKLVPSVQLEVVDEKKEETYAIYVTSSDEMDLFGKKPRYSKVLATQKLDRPVYPYQLNEIKVDNIIYPFSKVISAEVSFEDELFYMRYPDFNLEVWGETRKEVEEAFDFMLRNIIRDIYLEVDENLTPKAQILKTVLKANIKSK